MRAKTKPSEKSLTHPYFGKINLYYNGAYSPSILESVQTTAFYYALVDTENAVPMDNGSRYNKSQSISTLSSTHKVGQGGEDETISLSLVEIFVNITRDYSSEMYADDFKVKFRDGKVVINCDDTPIVMKDDKALSLLRRVGRRVTNRTIDELLHELAGRWEKGEKVSLD